MLLSVVRSLMSPALIRVKQRVVGWASSVFASRVLLYCVGISLYYLCVYLCNMIVDEGIYHLGGMCIGYMLGIYLV